MASCPNLNEEDETEQNGYLVGSSEVGSIQVVRQRHDETHADAQQSTHHQQHIDVVDEEASSSCCHIEQQTRSGDGTCPQPSADGEEEEVGNDDKQRRHAHDELYEQGVCLREMNLDDA